MPQAKNLTRRQRALIEDLFTSAMNEEQVLAKHGVGNVLYSRWLADEQFVAEFERRMTQAYRSGRLILARYAIVAASKLVALTDCEKEEVARKSCLDIITLEDPTRTAPSDAAGDPSEAGPAELPPETARRILAALAAPPGDTQVTDS